MKDTIPHLYPQLASVEIHLRPFGPCRSLKSRHYHSPNSTLPAAAETCKQFAQTFCTAWFISLENLHIYSKTYVFSNTFEGCRPKCTFRGCLSKYRRTFIVYMFRRPPEVWSLMSDNALISGTGKVGISTSWPQPWSRGQASVRHPRMTGGTPPPNRLTSIHNRRGDAGMLERH